MIQFDHGILEFLNYTGYKRSAIVINKSIVFTAATILLPIFEDKNSNLTNAEKEKFLENLVNFKYINGENLFFQLGSHLNFTIYWKDEKINNFCSHKARLHLIFNSTYLLEILDGISSTIYTNPSKNTNFSRLMEILSSSFVIFQINGISEINTLNCFKDFRKYIKENKTINKLDRVYSLSTPFGMLNFYNTVNIGKIINIFGKSNCIFMVSNNLISQSDGVGILNDDKELIGIVIYPARSDDNPDINLVLVANLKNIFDGYFKNDKINLRLADVPHIFEKHVCFLSFGDSWGSGAFIIVKDRKFILTCAHVVREAKENVSCRYFGGTFTSRILWINPMINRAYDIALLEVPNSFPISYCATLSDKYPAIGEKVYALGFPLFSYLGRQEFRACINEGRIIKASTIILMSDTNIQAGQSGGPLFDKNRAIVGISVCNAKDTSIDKIYSNFCFSVPAANIKPVLEKYVTSNDIGDLNGLIANTEINYVWDLKNPLISKL